MAKKKTKKEKKLLAQKKAKKDSTHNAHQKRMFEKYSNPEEACKNIKKDGKGKKSHAGCIAHAKKFTADYLEREYGEPKTKKK